MEDYDGKNSKEKSNFFYFSICHNCKMYPHILCRCVCRRIYYCSNECRLKDWNFHKDLCQAIMKSNLMVGYRIGCSPQDFNCYKTACRIIWSSELQRMGKRGLTWSYQHDMWMFPRVCSICFSPKVLTICTMCLSVGYCSTVHKIADAAKHSQFCTRLQFTRIMATKAADSKFPIINTPTWKNLPSNKIVKKLPANIKEIMHLLSIKYGKEYTTAHFVYAIMSDLVCPGANIIHTLETSGFIKDRLVQKPQMIIHIVGDHKMKVDNIWKHIMQFINHWVGNLQEIRVFFVGPNFENYYANQMVDFNNANNCLICFAKNFGFQLINAIGLYHPLYQTLPSPDIIVSFNNGAHDFQHSVFDLWVHPIPRLMKLKNIPILLAAYNQRELELDLQRFPEDQIQVLVPPQNNPYRNLWHSRNWLEGEDPVYYLNSYYAIIIGT